MFQLLDKTNPQKWESVEEKQVLEIASRNMQNAELFITLVKAYPDTDREFHLSPFSMVRWVGNIKPEEDSL